MKKTLFLIVLLFLISLQSSLGAFRVKYTVVRNLPVLTTSGNTNAPATDYGSTNASLLSAKADSFVHRYNGNHHPAYGRNDTNGILSLIFGIAGVATCWIGGGVVFGIPAMILGSIGTKRHQKHSNAGLTLGYIGLTLTLAVAVFAAFIFLVFLPFV